MEPHGTVKCAKQVWNLCIVCMETFCSDDNSSLRATLRHAIEMPIEKGYITNGLWMQKMENGLRALVDCHQKYTEY